MDDLRRRVGELEDELKRRAERVSELREEVDAFCMVMGDNGKYTWDSFIDARDEIVGKYIDLVRRWNKMVPLLKRPTAGKPGARRRPPGRKPTSDDRKFTADDGHFENCHFIR